LGNGRDRVQFLGAPVDRIARFAHFSLSKSAINMGLNANDDRVDPLD